MLTSQSEFFTIFSMRLCHCNSIYIYNKGWAPFKAADPQDSFYNHWSLVTKQKEEGESAQLGRLMGFITSIKIV